MTNRLVLSGTVCRTPLRKVSPSGIPHCQFVLEHRSVQEEAGFHRQAWCQMPVIVSGHEKPGHYSQYNGRQSHNRSGVHFMPQGKERTEQNGFACRAD
ncbi:primosomal replication protein N [Escherichia coli]|uniref:Primosomal replication protein N n=1 Tax=Escherichia coli TaxID=562 RepID=A0A376LHV6_ECOLX|nr:primosomal replication protein N [Escherichia coli]